MDTILKMLSQNNNGVKVYNKFLLTQVFKAAAPENIRKLLSHKDQTQLTIDDIYQTFFMDHKVETDKREAKINAVTLADTDNQDTSAPEQEVAAF
jgi:hypothetical protein